MFMNRINSSSLLQQQKRQQSPRSLLFNKPQTSQRLHNLTITYTVLNAPAVNQSEQSDEANVQTNITATIDLSNEEVPIYGSSTSEMSVQSNEVQRRQNVEQIQSQVKAKKPFGYL